MKNDKMLDEYSLVAGAMWEDLNLLIKWEEDNDREEYWYMLLDLLRWADVRWKGKIRLRAWAYTLVYVTDLGQFWDDREWATYDVAKHFYKYIKKCLSTGKKLECIYNDCILTADGSYYEPVKIKLRSAWKKP